MTDDALRALVCAAQTFKPVFRVKMGRRILGVGVPDAAQPGDLVVGNRGAAARVKIVLNSRVLALDYVGNYYDGARPCAGCKLWDFR